MLTCPKCNHTYPEDFVLCPQDGTPLVLSVVWAQGTVIRDKYRLGEQLGTGGMATVYRADHIRLREEVALKVINADLAADKVLAARFAQEAVMTRKLAHPNIVRVQDIETAEDGRPFIVMELVRGTVLKDELKKGPFPLHRALSIAAQLAEGLQAAHDIGMVHRDIKPGNIMLSPATAAGGAEQAKILDFGIARVKEALSDHNTQDALTLTVTGMVIGTPAYMSPEQAMGKGGSQIDARADLYSLGAVTYQMLTGQPPLAGSSAIQLIQKHIEAQPTPIDQLLPQIPKHVATAVMMCLAKDPAQRPRSCRDFIAALHNDGSFVAPPQPGTQTTALAQAIVFPRKYRLSHLLLVAAAMVILIGLGIAASMLRKSGHTSSQKAVSHQTPPPPVSNASVPKTAVPPPRREKHDEAPIVPLKTLAEQQQPVRPILPANALLSPSILRFAPQPMGTRSASQSATVRNTGAQPLVISDVKANREFAVVGSTCGIDALAAGATCSVSVAFSPQDAGPRTGALQFIVTSTSVPYNVELKGVGVASINGSLYFIPQSLEVLSDAEAISRTKAKSAAMCPAYAEPLAVPAFQEADAQSLKVALSHGLTLCPDRRLPEKIAAVWNAQWGVFLWNPNQPRSVSAFTNILYERARKEEFPPNSLVFGLDGKPLPAEVTPLFKPRETNHSQ